MFSIIAAFALFATPGVERADTFVVTGRLQYIDGDRLLTDCAQAEPCMETLVRDERLQRDVVGLQGKIVTLRVRRVPRCDSRSSGVACIQGNRPTVLQIVEWVHVN